MIPVEIASRRAAIEAVAGALFDARGGRGEGLVAVPLPANLLEELGGTELRALRARSAVSWETPAESVHLFGFGETVRLRGEREEDLVGAMPALRALWHHAIWSDVEHSARPRFFGGCRFEPDGPVTDAAWQPFGGWQFVLPRILVVVADGIPSGSITALVRDGDSPESLASAIERDFTSALEPPPTAPGALHHPTGLDADGWQDAVAAAVREIREGEYEKVVLARQVEADAPAEGPAAVVDRLAARYPNCFVFSFRAGGSAWVGASPELLVSLRDGQVLAASLASSRPRGATPETDDAFARELMTSEKERSEHAFVVAAIEETLKPLCADLSVPAGPELMRLPNIQHLYTPISGSAAEGVDILDLVRRMHPTPAVGGSPRDVAIRSVSRLEGMDRGWYAAPIGWLDLNGDGQFAVALRSALVTGGRAVLFAGAGIVAGSDPAQELAETELKFRPLREALQGA